VGTPEHGGIVAFPVGVADGIDDERHLEAITLS
jgi:hypothetical protein